MLNEEEAVAGVRGLKNCPNMHGTRRSTKGYTPAKTIVHGLLVFPEGYDRAGVLLSAVSLVGVGRVEHFCGRIEAKKARRLRVGRRPVRGR